MYREIFLKWFDFHLHLCNIYSIEENDTYNLDEKDNALGDNTLGCTLNVIVIIYIYNKSSFCLITTNQEWISIIEFIFRDIEKRLIYMIFQKSNIKLA